MHTADPGGLLAMKINPRHAMKHPETFVQFVISIPRLSAERFHCWSCQESSLRVQHEMAWNDKRLAVRFETCPTKQTSANISKQIPRDTDVDRAGFLQGQDATVACTSSVGLRFPGCSRNDCITLGRPILWISRGAFMRRNSDCTNCLAQAKNVL